MSSAHHNATVRLQVGDKGKLGARNKATVRRAKRYPLKNITNDSSTVQRIGEKMWRKKGRKKPKVDLDQLLIEALRYFYEAIEGDTEQKKEEVDKKVDRDIYKREIPNDMNYIQSVRLSRCEFMKRVGLSDRRSEQELEWPSKVESDENLSVVGNDMEVMEEMANVLNDSNEKFTVHDRSTSTSSFPRETVHELDVEESPKQPQVLKKNSTTLTVIAVIVVVLAFVYLYYLVYILNDQTRRKLKLRQTVFTPV